jgi:ligand-binding sensor domain-containing protein
MRSYPVLAFLLSLNSLHAISHVYEFHHEKLSEEIGLSGELNSCIFRDSRGFMWFGSRNGLRRFDGYTFKQYTHNGFDTTSISDRQVLAMQEDKLGNLWVGTSIGGLNRYDRFKDEFTRFPGPENDPFNLRNASVFAVCILGSGDIWFSAQ